MSGWAAIRERECRDCGRSGVAFYTCSRICAACTCAKERARRERKRKGLPAWENPQIKVRTVICREANASSFRELLDYDPITGHLVARMTWGKHRTGDRVGTTRKDGRRQVRIGGKIYLEHRVIWLMVHGEWPLRQIDHKDLNRANNSLENLRVSDNSQNNANKRVRADNKTGLKGVKYDKRRGLWYSRITVKWKCMHLGSYHSPEEAAAAYREAADKYFGEFARHG